MTSARTWRTSIIADREAEYEAFARGVSLPMFHRQQGFLGVMMTRNDTDCSVTTFWRDKEAIEAFEGSRDYQQTVGELLATGLLAGVSTIEVGQIHLLDLELAGIADASGDNDAGDVRKPELSDAPHGMESTQSNRVWNGNDR